MATDNTNDWKYICSSMAKWVEEGQRLTWRKSYNDTKSKEVLDYFGYDIDIYEVRNSEECMEIRKLGKYHLPEGLDDICADLFSLSMTHKLIAVDAEYLEMVVEESKDGSTNIDETVMEAMMDIQKKVAKQLGRRKAR